MALKGQLHHSFATRDTGLGTIFRHGKGWIMCVCPLYDLEAEHPSRRGFPGAQISSLLERERKEKVWNGLD